eukprot:jgi/Psemu1/264706/estExt_Genewise1Plus.C_21740005
MTKNTTIAPAVSAFVPHFLAPYAQRCVWYSSKILNKENNFVVSILGPPNAGKSTLFNRLQCKERNKTYRLGSSRGKKGGKKSIKGRISSNCDSRGDAIVSSVAGTTRDRRECWGRIGGTEFILMDTAGVDGDRIQTLSSRSEKHAMERAMMEQTIEAARQSDLVLLMWDARVGVTQDLMITARWLRKLGKLSNVVVVANKLEGDSWAHNAGSPVLEHLHDVLRLGLGEAIPISALQGDGLADIAILIEQLKARKLEDMDVDEHKAQADKTPQNNDNEQDSKPLQIAIIGRQNVGKSTLVNTLVKNNRVLAGPTPGLTRDAIAVEWMWEDKLVQLVDTAGIRKLTKRMDDSIEDMAVADALRAMKVAEVAVLVLDAEEMYVQRQELALCSAVLNEGRSLVIAANKMDLLEMSSKYSPRDFANNVREQIEERIPILRNIPVVPMSGLSGKGVSELLPTVLDARNRWSRTISTGLLNRWLAEVVTGSRPPVVDGVRAKLKYIIQTKGRPPTFMIFSNVNKFPDPYLRYLTKHFQDSFELFGMPVRLIVKSSSKSNPYNDKEKKKRGGFGLGGRKARFERRIKEFKAKSKRTKKRLLHTSTISRDA